MKRTAKFLILLFLLFLLLILTAMIALSQSESDYWKTDKYKEVITGIKEAKMGYSDSEIDSLFSDARLKFYPDIHGVFKKAKKMERSTTSNVYLNFLKPGSVKNGKEFLENHIKFLEEVERTSGIEKETVVALFRVESNFGRYQKTHQTFGVLNSIIYYGEPNSSRTDWGKKHLVSFMKFHKNMGEDVGKDIFSIYSSYAGALGIPQFLPYNYERYAVDGNGDGKIDLFNSFADAAWSTVNLLKANGWFENKRRALYRWNRSTKFVNCILEYSEQLKEKTSEAVILE